MRKPGILILAVFLILNTFCTSQGRKALPKDGETVSGKVVAVLDGDTYDVMIWGNEKIRVRMEGIDAPERGMPFYQVSKKYLNDLCYGKQVTLDVTGTDQYGRTLGFTYLEDGRELGREMVKAGLAWHYKYYNSDTILSNLENEAKRLKKGLWIDKNPMPPWENRRLHRKGISTKDSFVKK